MGSQLKKHNMKKLFVGLFLLLASCSSPSQKGHYRIKIDGVEHKATAITIVDEEEKIKYKDMAGKVHTYEGSFEVYED